MLIKDLANMVNEYDQNDAFYDHLILVQCHKYNKCEYDLQNERSFICKKCHHTTWFRLATNTDVPYFNYITQYPLAIVPYHCVLRQDPKTIICRTKDFYKNTGIWCTKCLGSYENSLVYCNFLEIKYDLPYNSICSFSCLDKSCNYTLEKTNGIHCQYCNGEILGSVMKFHANRNSNLSTKRLPFNIVSQPPVIYSKCCILCDPIKNYRLCNINIKNCQDKLNNFGIWCIHCLGIYEKSETFRNLLWTRLSTKTHTLENVVADVPK